jgi:muramoyltetrapeptide carboxypeptidase
MIKPRRLVKGDTVCIIAPARKVSREQIDHAIRTLAAWGLNVLLGDNLFRQSHTYLAGTDEERFSDFQKAINDPTVKAIFSARGGYGAGRILDSLNLSSLQTSPKWIVGFSDITSVHLKLFHTDIMSVHGTMPILFGLNDSAASVESLRQILFEDLASLSFPSATANIQGTASGRLIGGNLSLVIDSLGTSSEPDTRDCILLIEEIDEYKYRVDRMMNHLKRAGKLEGLKGLVVGHMTDIKESELPFSESIEQIILDKTRDYRYPIAFGCPSGHDNPNRAWIHGELYQLEVGEKQTQLTARSFAL